MAQGANPAMTQPAGTPNVMQTSANLYNTAAAGPNVGQFFNPFTQNVIGSSMANLNRANQMALNNVGAQAGTVGAYGGSRHGIAEAETNRAFLDQAGTMAGNMAMQGWQNALGAAQGQQGINAQLARQGFDRGRTLNADMAGVGAQQQALQQMLIDAARAQFSQWATAPQQALQLPLAAVGAANMGQSTTTQTQKPGLFNYLALALGGI